MFSLFFKHNRKQAIAATINIPTRKKTKKQKHKNEIQNKKQKKNKKKILKQSKMKLKVH